MIHVKTLLPIGCLLVFSSCKDEQTADEDPLKGVYAARELSEAAKAEFNAEQAADRDPMSVYAGLDLSKASHRLAEAKERAEAAGLTRYEISFKVADAKFRALEKEIDERNQKAKAEGK